jgi:hypothetical protein
LSAKSNRPNELASTFPPEVVAEIVCRTRAQQGLPPKITDPLVLGRLAVLIRALDQTK